MAPAHFSNLLVPPNEHHHSKTTDISTSKAKRPSLAQFIQNKENFNSSQKNSFFQDTFTDNRINEQPNNKQIFDIPSDKMINYDDQLKQYLSGNKIFKQKDHNFPDLTQPCQTPYTHSVNKPPQHQRIKSRSQLTPHEFSSFNSVQFSNCNTTYGNQSFGVPLVKKSTVKQLEIRQGRVSEFRRKTQKNRKSIKFWEVNQEKFKNVELKSLEMQLIVKKANEKRQTIIKEIIKKLHFPQLNPKFSNSLRMLVDNYPLKDEIQSQHRSIKLQKSKHSKLFIGKIEDLSTMKVKQGKGKDLRRLEKEVYMNRIKFNKMKDGQVTSRSKNYGRQVETIENFRLFGK